LTECGGGTVKHPKQTLEGAMARMFGGPAASAGAEAAPGPSVRPEGSVKTLLDAAASAIKRANEELRRLEELLRRLREAGGR